MEKAIGSTTGFLGCRIKDSDMGDKNVRMLGYYPSLGEGIQYLISSKITSYTTKTMRLDDGAGPGMSGGPVLRNSDNYVLGMIYGGKEGSHTTCVRITQHIVDLINKYKK